MDFKKIIAVILVILIFFPSLIQKLGFGVRTTRNQFAPSINRVRKKRMQKIQEKKRFDDWNKPKKKSISPNYNF